MRKLFITTALFLSIFTVNNLAHAEDVTAHQFILDSSHNVLNAIGETKADNQENIKKLGNKLLNMLENVVDFKSISKAVMGKHGKTATEEQRNKFIPIFKHTITQLYAKSLVKFKITHIAVTPPESGKILKTKGNVSMEVATDNGKTYSIVYTMRKNKNNEWRVRNIVLNGINLGLTYRNQFDSAMASYNGDIDKTIENWAKEMDL